MATNSRSDFTAEKNYTIDTFVEMFELSAMDVENVKAWKTLKAKANKTDEEMAHFTNLTEVLSGKLVTAEDWNKLCDCMINLEQMYVDKGLNEIDNTVKEYVEEYAEKDINDKLGTTINNLLLTNATEIIISHDTPTVKNGAIWFQPKKN